MSVIICAPSRCATMSSCSSLASNPRMLHRTPASISALGGPPLRGLPQTAKPIGVHSTGRNLITRGAGGFLFETAASFRRIPLGFPLLWRVSLASVILYSTLQWQAFRSLRTEAEAEAEEMEEKEMQRQKRLERLQGRVDETNDDDTMHTGK